MLDDFVNQVSARSATVGVIGLGYVGLPLARAFLRAGFPVVGLDTDERKPELLRAGRSYLRHLPAEDFTGFIEQGRFRPTSDYSLAAECRALIICVPTPLRDGREPDTSFIENTGRQIAPHLRRGVLVALESTTWPGCTEQLLRPVLERGSGLRAGKDFFLVYSPEREDPGNQQFHTANIPKVLGGYTAACRRAGAALYGAVVERVVEVDSCATAEMVKLFENVYRAVNIALVNELKLICERLGLDVWQVIAAAATKPFGFQSFRPGPGLGGHCIPIDPFYLSWRARQVEMPTRFIELAGEINTAMPRHVVERVQEALNDRGKPLRGSRVLVLGVAYKPNVDDVRESPAYRIIELLAERGARVEYHDPYVAEIVPTRQHHLRMSAVPLTKERLREADCVLLVTDHDGVDYELVAREAELVVDTRNRVPRGRGNVVMA